MNKYEEYILEYLQEKGFEIGKELNQALIKKFAISSVNARKIIERAAGSALIISSNPVSFGNGQFAYLPIGKYLNKQMVLQIVQKHRPPLYRIISLMDIHDGVLSYYEAMKVSGSPTENEKIKTDNLEKLIRELKQLNLVYEKSDARNIHYLIGTQIDENKVNEVMQNHFVKMKMDAMFVPDILRSLQSYNIIDNIKVLYRSKELPSLGAKHSNFIWDAIAYTKTTGINQSKASQANTIEKQTMVVLDIVIHRPYTDHDFQGFYSRVQSVLNSVKTGVRKVLPIIVYSSMETKLLSNTIHKLGFLTFDLGTIYGSRIYDIIKNITSLKVELTTMTSDKDIPSLVEDTLSTIKNAGQEDNLKNIKGDLFEFLMQPVLREKIPNTTIQHGKKINDPKNKREGYEYDYIIPLTNNNEAIIFELKGYMSNARIPLGTHEDKNTVKWFFGKTFPFASKTLNHESHIKMKACYITSGTFDDVAKEYLEKLSRGSLKSTKIDLWYDRKKLFELLDELNLKKIKSIIDRYYKKE